MSAAVVISSIGAHTGARHSVFAERYTGRNSSLFKRSIFFVQIKLVGLRVVGNQNVRPAIRVVIENGDAQAFRSRVAEAGFLGCIFELSAAKVMP